MVRSGLKKGDSQVSGDPKGKVWIKMVGTIYTWATPDHRLYHRLGHGPDLIHQPYQYFLTRWPLGRGSSGLSSRFWVDSGPFVRDNPRTFTSEPKECTGTEDVTLESRNERCGIRTRVVTRHDGEFKRLVSLGPLFVDMVDHDFGYTGPRWLIFPETYSVSGSNTPVGVRRTKGNHVPKKTWGETGRGWIEFGNYN